MKLLLADDDRDLVDLLRYAFQREGYTVVTALDGSSALRAFELEAPDLVILDLSMPKCSGLEVLREIRRNKKVPVLVLSVTMDEDSVVNALDLGADDYLAKPFRPRELKARVRALVRRRQTDQDRQIKELQPITLGKLSLKPRSLEVAIDGRAVRLTTKEFSLLHYLLLNHDIVLHPSDILANVWGYDAEEDTEVVRVAISRLRQKIEPNPSQPIYILNIHGAGYKFQYKVANS